jgi:hypothetical protein
MTLKRGYITQFSATKTDAAFQTTKGSGKEMTEGQILAKGVNFLYAKRFITERYGDATWSRIMVSLPEEAQEIWSEAILVNKEYPFAAFKAAIKALAGVLGGARDQELAHIYEYIADQSLNKIYKIYFSLTSPSVVIRNYPKLWDKFFSTGKVEVSVVEKCQAVLKFTLPDVFLDWLPPACLGYSKKAIELGGGRNVTLKPVSTNKLRSGEWEIMYKLNWSE